jgi:3',5'-cyclic AMP phosphodiesterase CpdA
MARPRPAPARTLAAALLLHASACQDPELTPGDAATLFTCEGAANAWLLAPDPEPAAARLTAAGFTVAPLPLDRSPRDLGGLIVFGSRASGMPAYRDYMRRHAADLHAFVADAGVLLALPQRSEREPVPPYLPHDLAARRDLAALDELEVLAPDSPLLAAVDRPGGRLLWRGELARDAFVEQDGFEVVLAARGDGTDAALLEGAHGDGRVILSALALDVLDPPDAAHDALATAFFANLATHVDGVCARRAAPVRPTPSPGTATFTPGATTFAVLPDTQWYARRFPAIFDRQTTWIANHVASHNIAYVFHLGDIVNSNTVPEWQRARESMRILDGIVPYALVPGNHDYGPFGDASTRDTRLNEWFPYAETAAMPSFGGAYQPGRLDNTFHLFTAGGHDWIAVMLEWAPRDEVVDWADAVMTAHPDRLGILVTHAYLDHDDRRYDHTDQDRPQPHNPHGYSTPGSVNDGEQLWQKLVRRHRFVLTLNGHVLGDGAGRLASVTDRGNVVHQILANYQMRQLGGEGYLRLLELLPDGRTLRVRSYSPLWDRDLLGPDQRFTLELDVD